MINLLDFINISESSNRKYFDDLQCVTIDGDYTTFKDAIDTWWNKYEKTAKENTDNVDSKERYSKNDDANTETLDTATHGIVSHKLDKSKCITLYKYAINVDRSGERPFKHEIKTVSSGKKAASPEKLQATRCIKFNKNNCLELDSSKGKVYISLDDDKSNVFIGLTAENIYVVDPKIMEDSKNFDTINSAIMDYCREKSF